MIQIIIKIVFDYFHMNPILVNSTTRKREIVQSRQISMYFAKKLTKYSLAEIGYNIGGKDHATVLHAIKTVNNLIDTDKKIANYIADLEMLLDQYKEKVTIYEPIIFTEIEIEKAFNTWVTESIY